MNAGIDFIDLALVPLLVAFMIPQSTTIDTIPVACGRPTDFSENILSDC